MARVTEKSSCASCGEVGRWRLLDEHEYRLRDDRFCSFCAFKKRGELYRKREKERIRRLIQTPGSSSSQ